MLTIEKLNEYGVNTKEGITRCANNEALYLKLVNTIPSNPSFNLLYSSINNNNLDLAFQYAHGLKGILSNLSLEPILSPVIEITEHLRNKDKIDYSSYLTKIEEMRKKLEDLL